MKKKIWTKEEKQLADEICEKINNDPVLNMYDGLYGWKKPKATPRYLKDEKDDSKN